MKKKKTFMLIFTCAALALTPASSAFAEAPDPSTAVTSPAATPTVTPAPSKPVRNGWYTMKNGRKKYYRNGKLLRGYQKIGKRYYIFSPKGVKQVNRAFKYGKYTYFADEKGYVTAKKRGSTYYTPAGKKMNPHQLATFLSKQIVKQITNSRMSKEQKLQTCFNWVIRKYYYTWRRFDQAGKYWPGVNANDHFIYGKGDCIADASAFAYLAKAIGYKKVYVCADAKQSNNNAHSWAEINGRVYDPLFAEAKSYSKYYGASYGTYGLYPILRYRLS